MTIAEAAQTVLSNADKPLKVQEIYDEIIRQNLYTFGAKNPKGVMSQAIRERSDANPAAKVMVFKSLGQGTYTLAN